ncbi:hypothetical protein KVR01_010588 [Diaporthe batatas]|uniref:uncharacterized protein n=1 Tax=Diaporthe batatas TaxID=748121 RepID=UPI001D044DFA|nr:uncharacterized protein KVR01_010588 [Diaporthe batatas]KAG8159951.1 hypothetical protein KVR01_010588 [Diaporthe batatas]
MSDAHDHPQPEGHVSDVVIMVISAVVLLATVPTIFLLVWLKIVNPEYFRRDVCREANLPATEPSSNMRLQGNPLCRNVRAVVSKLRGVAVAMGGAVALRSREALKEVRGRASKVFAGRGRGRRYSDLPIMRQKSWQILAESHTELTMSASKDDKVEHKVDEVEHKTVENPKKSAKTVRFAIGDEVEKDTPVQKPQPAVIADKT